MSEAYLALSPWVQALADGTAQRTAQALTAISGLTATAGECTVRLLGPAHLVDETLPPGFLAEAALSGEVAGNLLMSLALPDALALARTLLGVGADSATMDEVTMAAVQEGVGQAASALESTLGPMAGRQFKIDLKPGSAHDRPITGSELVTEGEEGIVELAITIAAGTESFRIRAFFDLGTIMELENYVSAARTAGQGAASVGGAGGADGAAASSAGRGAAATAGTQPGAGSPATTAGGAPSGSLAAGGAGATGGAGKGSAGGSDHPTPAFTTGADGGPRVQPAHFNDLSFGMPERDRGNIDLLMDVPLSITVELGRTKRLVRDILSFGPGSVVELDRTAGESLDILVNGRLIARGEVVIVNENFGIRLTEIISQMDKVATPR